MSLRALARRKRALLARSTQLRGQIRLDLRPAVRALRLADRVLAGVRAAARLAPLYALLRR